MASSSSSFLLTKHDVFLSFRGEDTRYNFVSHVYKDLQNKKIQTFIDNDLERGDEISQSLISGIEASKISIIIFSENYGGSKWCLDELVKILECREARHQIVIPVFYNVEPTHVRNQTGNFGRAFNRLLESHQVRPVGIFSQNIAPSKSAKEQIWRNALKEAGSLSGCVSFNNESEATLIDNITADVLKKLKMGSSKACDDRGLVGINSSMEKIVRLLRTESPEVLMVGIWGMGGIGKTTIAGQVFNKISSKFDSCCFLRDVGEQVNKEGLAKMRNKLISELLKDEKLEIHTPRIGDGSIKDRLRRTKVLVVLDDVDGLLQLEELIGERGTNQFGQGSRVIVTTRNKRVLEAHDITCVYDMQMLDDRDALELFRFYAFRQNQPSELYVEISEEFVKYAKGVPLALKVLGSSLRGKVSIGHWRGELQKLKRIPNKEISEVLKISYESLTEEEKDIFLDISCFFKGMDVNKIRDVLDGGYVSLLSGMEVLIDKSLINITPRDNFIWEMNINVSIEVVEMHDLVQEMGWNIVNGESKEVGSRSRLWRDKDVYDVLTRNRGTDKIKAILWNVDWRVREQVNLDPQVFAKMHNLKFLKIEDVCEPSVIEFPSGLKSLPEGLRYLYWEWYPLDYLPPTFNPTNLVQLHLSSDILKQVWSRRQDLSSLKVLNIKRCNELIENPDLSTAVNLEELSLPLDYDENIFLSSIQHLNSLKYLNLESCAFREISFFSSSIQNLNSLKHLNLEYCAFTEISFSLQQLTNLTHLNLEYCEELMNISSSIQYLTNLKYLTLCSCLSLSEIPQSIKHLKNLTYLNLNHCTSLNEIPSSIEHLNSLIHLGMGGCTKLTKLPNLPQNIKFLIVDGILIEAYSFHIDHPFRLLTNLVELEMWNCTIDQPSSILLEQIKLLIPRGCKIIKKSRYGCIQVPTSHLPF